MSADLNKPTNTAIFTCYTFPLHFIIQSKLITDSVLHIDRKTKIITVKEKGDANFVQKNYIMREFSSLLGVMEIEGINFLVFCDDCKKAGGEHIKIYEISNVFFVCYLKEAELVYTGNKQEVLKKTHEMNQFFNRGFYFSYDYNVTQTLQYQHNPYAQEFAWNKVLLKPLRKHTNTQWLNPIIQGYVGTFTTILGGGKIQYYLISRRSWQKGGTRYFDRGVNQQGYVANFVETQQVIYIGDNLVASDVQIRGSVPIYFQQTGLTTKVKISRSNQMARQSFKAHFQYCLKRYGRVFIVNLLDTEKGGQKIIIDEYEKHIKQINDPKVKYYYYNFHQNCPKNSFHNVNKAIDVVHEMRQNLGYYIVNTETNQTYNRQMGAFRTNCLDCLDRTNVFQSKLAIATLRLILCDVGINLQDSSNLIEEMDKNKDALDFIKDFKTLWADNGDQISFHYTGTGSTHSDFTRSGSRGFTGIFKHKAKTITRFYNQNFWDFNKMKLVDMVLASKKSQLQNQRIPSLLKAKQNTFCTYRDINIQIVAWKVAKMLPSKQFFPFVKSDIYIVGLQAIDSSSVNKWVQYIQQSIQKVGLQDKYIELSRCYGNNNFLIGFIKNDLKSNVSNIQTCSVKFSNILNYLSNKSATVIRFDLDDNSLVFGSCQLQYGSQYSKNRVDNLKQIYSSAFQGQVVGKKKSDMFQTHQYQFLLGNFNMSLNLNDDVIKRKVKQLINLKQQSKTDTGYLSDLRLKTKQLLKYDEFISKDENTQILRDYEQPAISFIPNYKYQKGKIKLDESRTPGWADRIMYSSQRHVQCLDYDTAQIYLSDHLPVVGRYKITIDKQDPLKKQQAYGQILKQLHIQKPQIQQDSDINSMTRITQKSIRYEDEK